MWKQYICPSILAVLSIAGFFLEVLPYKGHTGNNGWSVYVSIFVIIFCLVKLLNTSKIGALMYVGVILISLFLAYWESKIPFCPLCDGLTAKDLGFLSFWISTE